MVSDPKNDTKGLVMSARGLLERNWNKGHYTNIMAEVNRESLKLLNAKIKEAAITEQPISYSEWIVGVEWQTSSGQSITISPPEWDREEKEIVGKILEFIALTGYALHGFLLTSLIYDGRDQKTKLSSNQLSVLMQEIEHWRYNPNHYRKVDPEKHERLVREHRQQAYRHFQELSQAKTE